MDPKIIELCKSSVKSGKLRIDGFLSSCITPKLRDTGAHLPVYSLAARYNVVTESNGEFKVSHTMHGICHGGLRSLREHNVVAINTMVMPFHGPHTHNWPDEESLLSYYHWIANDGPVAHAFVTKDPKEMIEEGCIIDPVGIPGREMLMALILTRQPSELHYKRFGVQLFAHLMRRGVLPSLAMIIAWGIRCDGDVDKGTYHISGFDYYSVASGHAPYSMHHRALIDYKRLILNKPKVLDASTFRDGGWSGVHAMFDGGGQLTKVDQELVGLIVKAIAPHALVRKTEGSGWNARYVFEGKQDRPALYDDIADAVLPFQAKALKSRGKIDA